MSASTQSVLTQTETLAESSNQSDQAIHQVGQATEAMQSLVGELGQQVVQLEDLGRQLDALTKS